MFAEVKYFNCFSTIKIFKKHFRYLGNIIVIVVMDVFLHKHLLSLSQTGKKC